MAQFVEVPLSRLPAATLEALLEEYASRDGTDYGARELSLAEKVDNLRHQLQQGQLGLVYESESEQWDLVPAERLADVLR